MELPSVFNAAEHQGLDDFTPIPMGTYIAEIVKSELKNTKAGTGNYLSLRFKVLEGEHAGRVLFNNINIKNPNPIAVEIGQKTLKSICDAIGLVTINDSEQLHGRPMSINVRIKDDPVYGPGNEIKGYKSVEGVTGETSGNPFS